MQIRDFTRFECHRHAMTLRWLLLSHRGRIPRREDKLLPRDKDRGSLRTLLVIKHGQHKPVWCVSRHYCTVKTCFLKCQLQWTPFPSYPGQLANAACPGHYPDPASQILGGRGRVGVSKTVYECPQLYPVDWLVPPNLKITRYTSALTRGTPSLCPQRLACCLTQDIAQKYQLIPVSGNPRSISYLGRFRAYIKQCRYRHFLTHL